MKYLLIVGCARSGTTLLTSLLGGHSKINMLDGAFDDCVKRLTGKMYQGIKFVIPTIKYNRKSTILKMLLYRKLAFLRKILSKIGIDHTFFRGCPYSIKYFIKHDAKIIFIYRDKTANIESLMERARYNYKNAQKAYYLAKKIKRKLIKNYKDLFVVSFTELTHEPQPVLEKICVFLDIKFESAMLESSGLNITYKNDKITPKI